MAARCSRQPVITNEQASVFERQIGYEFSNRVLLTEALTHASQAKRLPGGVFCNERLEFLGDRVLGLIIAEELAQRFSHESVGDFAARFARLVDKATLGEIARQLGIQGVLRYAEEKGAAVGTRNIGPLADACEALIAAIYLDGGLDAARSFVLRHWQGLLVREDRPQRDPKSVLQEWAQGRGLPRPSYRELSRAGPAHLPIFSVEVVLQGFAPTAAEGPSKRHAEQAAAALMLEAIASATEAERP
jgi:ribonuclease-3